MKPAAWIVVSLIGLPALAPAHASAGAMRKSQTAVEKTREDAEKATDAVVRGATTAAEKTRDGLNRTGEVMTDGLITTRVHARFIGERLLKESDISVSTDNHVVTLRGTVTARAGRARAARIARRTEGVLRVVNRLTIGPPRN